MALLYLMTILILPGDQDRIVARMIQSIEFHRTDLPPDLTNTKIYRPPSPIEDNPLPVELTKIAEDPAEDAPAHVIDWRAEVREITQESSEKAFKRWLLEQGHDRYVSIMQGPLPITNSVRGTPPPTQEDATGYLNSFGDLELIISENCVAQTQVAARHDVSDFTQKLLMRVDCKTPKVKYSFDRHEHD